MTRCTTRRTSSDPALAAGQGRGHAPTPRGRRLLGVLASLACLLAFGPLPVSSAAAPAPGSESSAAADSGSEGTLTWAVDPADADGPDGRSWVELTLDPGETVSDQIAVRNLSPVPATFAIRAADGYFTDNGRFSMKLASDESTDAGRWIEVQDTVEVAARSTALVPFTVTVPENATPGDHAAGLAASIMFAGDGTLTVNGRVGIRVITRVTGEVAPSVTVSEMTAAYDTAWNPFTAGGLDITASLVNDGNVSLDVAPTARVGGRDVALALASGATTVTMLPGDVRTVTGRVSEVWPLGPLSVQVTAVGSGSGLEPVTATATGSTWAVPLPQVLALAGVALLLLTLRGDSRRRRRKLVRLLADARSEGREEGRSEPQQAAAGTAVRIARSVRTGAVAGLVAALLVGAGAAHAALPDREGVRVDVVIPTELPTATVRPTATVSPTATPSPTSSGTTAVTSTPSRSTSTGAGPIGATGVAGTVWTLAAAATLLAGGAVLLARRRVAP